MKTPKFKKSFPGKKYIHLAEYKIYKVIKIQSILII